MIECSTNKVPMPVIRQVSKHIEYRKGNIFDAIGEVDAITNTINCVGVMGKGLALAFKNRYPAMFKAYRLACSNDEITTGKIWLWENNGKWVINFPTKAHWRNPSEYSYIVSGLEDLERVIAEKKLTSIALAPLGCGNGGLSWPKVKELIESFHKKLPDNFKLIVYEP